MKHRASLPAVAIILAIAVGVPALAVAWVWQGYSGFPPELDDRIVQLDVHGSKGIMICDVNEFMYSVDGGASWAPISNPPWHLQAMGMTRPLSCACRGDQVLLGGQGFVAVYNTATASMSVERMDDGSEAGGLIGRIQDIIGRGPADWGLRGVDIRKGPNDNEMLAVGYAQTADGGTEALILETSDHGQTWTPAETGLDWPHLNGAICQPVSYVIGPNRFLAQKNLDDDEPKWSRMKYPGYETVDITGWDGRQSTVWMAREDGSVMRRTGDAAWEVFEVSPAIERMKIAFRSPTGGVAIGNDRQGHGYAYHTTDGGETWELDSAPLTDWHTGWVEPSGNGNVKFISMVHTRDARDNVTDHAFYRPGLVMAPLRPATRPRVRMRR